MPDVRRTAPSLRRHMPPTVGDGRQIQSEVSMANSVPCAIVRNSKESGALTDSLSKGGLDDVYGPRPVWLLGVSHPMRKGNAEPLRRR